MPSPPVTHHVRDSAGRDVGLRQVTDENWRAVADVVPTDDQRVFVAPSAARYLLLSLREGVWTSLAVVADDAVIGHAMWGFDEDDGRHWVGGVMIDAAEQGRGSGRAAMQVLLTWLFTRPNCAAVRLSYRPQNTAARRLYAGLGFVESAVVDGDEVVAELSAARFSVASAPRSPAAD